MKRQVIGMKERINRLAKGIIDSEQPKMTWSPEKIDETLRMNTLMQRNLWIGSENGLSVKGFVYSSTEMGIFMPYFVSGEISFSVGAERMW